MEEKDQTENTANPGVPPEEPASFQPTPPMPQPPSHELHKRAKIFAIIFLFIIATSSGFLGGWLGAKSLNKNTAPDVRQQQVVLKTQGQLISQIAQNVGASVVSITVTGSPQSRLGRLVQQESAGTGIIISSDGLIVTNRHVVSGDTADIHVTLSDGTDYDNVQLLGRTSQSDSLDVAVLKIQDTKGKKLTPAIIGDSSKMQVGDTVVAIGNALGQFQNTVTTGIISGFGRTIQASDSADGNSENLEDLFQTDAAINEGNSGGPLVNLNGEVIGINTALAGGAQSIGFAIPINALNGIIKTVKETGKFERPYLGIAYLLLNDDIANQLNLKVKRGAYIAPPSVSGSNRPVLNGSPAAKAGLKEGDIITKVDGQDIDQNHSLNSLLSDRSVGDKVTLTVLRGDQTLTVTVTLEAFPQG